jgi:hypothetical protein
MAIAAAVGGLASAVLSEQWRFAASPLAALPLWLLLRFSTPVGGMRVRTIRGTPGTMPFLLWLSFILFLFLAFLVVDMVVFGRGSHDPLLWYHWVPTLLLFAVLIAGVHLIVRRYQEPHEHR